MTIKKPVKKSGKNFKNLKQKRQELKGEIADLKIPSPSDAEKKYLNEYMHLFITLRKMSRIAEQKYMENKSSRDVYALMAIYSQQREVIADIRSVADMSEQAQLITQNILQPFTSAVAQNILDIFYHLKKIIRDACRDEEVQPTLNRLDELMREQGKFLQYRYGIAEKEITEMFMRRNR